MIDELLKSNGLNLWLSEKWWNELEKLIEKSVQCVDDLVINEEFEYLNLWIIMMKLKKCWWNDVQIWKLNKLLCKIEWLIWKEIEYLKL